MKYILIYTHVYILSQKCWPILETNVFADKTIRVAIFKIFFFLTFLC